MKETAIDALRMHVTYAEGELSFDLEQVASNAESTAHLLLKIAKTREVIANYETAIEVLDK